MGTLVRGNRKRQSVSGSRTGHTSTRATNRLCWTRPVLVGKNTIRLKTTRISDIHNMTSTLDPHNGMSPLGSSGVERRFSLPTGYRLLNDLSSLKRQAGQRLRKDNLVTRGSVKVRHVPIFLEEDEKSGEGTEVKEVKKDNMMTAAPMMLQQTNGHQTSQKIRPPRFSLPSASVTESAKV